jgi:hypothetical protein
MNVFPRFLEENSSALRRLPIAVVRNPHPREADRRQNRRNRKTTLKSTETTLLHQGQGKSSAKKGVSAKPVLSRQLNTHPIP